jgi:tetratricopeptide (TPR) repeat protein
MPRFIDSGEKKMMRRLIPAWIILAIALLLPAISAAQDVRVSGQVLDRDGKPWAGLTVIIKSDSGRSFTLKTDNNGKFSQIGLTPGIYTVTVMSQANNLNYSEKHQFSSGEDNEVTINFKAILAQQSGAGNPEQEKKQQEAASQFKNMKAHVDAGVAALASAEDLRKQLRAASADQKSAIQGQLSSAYQTAVTELQQAEQASASNPKDTKNHAIILSDLGVAYSDSGKYDDAVASYQKAIELNPQAGYYNGLSSSLANSAAAQTDPAAVSSKITEAGAACDKASALQTPPNPGDTARCWKNIGIVLSNKGDLKEAIAPLLKATQSDPKDAQGWYLLGSAYTGTIDSKQEGDKMIYVIPPGTADAYQKCVDADPNGPLAAQCKTMLDSLASMSGGVSTMVGERKKKDNKKSH